jgi:hypothetical protein
MRVYYNYIINKNFREFSVFSGHFYDSINTMYFSLKKNLLN